MKRLTLMAALLTATSAPGVAQNCGWLERHPPNKPTNPASVLVAFDSARSVAVLFSSVSGDEPETLEWDGFDWILRSFGGPNSRSNAAMVYDSRRKVSVMYGGQTKTHTNFDTREWDGESWTSPENAVDAGPRKSHAMAYDSIRGVIVLFGGSDELSNSLGDTWEWDGITPWRKVADEGPSPRRNHAMAFDSERNLTVLYGGNVGASETWEWDGVSWTQRMVQGPGPRTSAAMVYDSDQRACIIFGGNDGDQFRDDAWSWDGQIWTELETSTTPPPRYGHAMAYDSTRGVTVLFGGTVGFPDFFDDTWELTCTPPCYLDLDGSGSLDLFDFLAFVNSFNAGDAGPADCDENEKLDFFDFLCFTNAFNEGC